ncbi:hypothetical protein D9C73_024463 [Collichthys lucidus]|uniref:Uncharacterized protein n=1 Tax=Collichthys lucidus TaxID=240159 RepID=A0A4U5VQB5_COLLU|nr:hypothetical protein D9C73_024463 [Collichthys lucidus]
MKALYELLINGCTNQQPTTSPPPIQPTTSPPLIKPTIQPSTSPLLIQPTTSSLLIQLTTSPPPIQPTTSPPLIQPTILPTTSPPLIQPTIQLTTSPPPIQLTTSPPPIQPTTSPPPIQPTIQPATSPPPIQPTIQPATSPPPIQPTTSPPIPPITEPPQQKRKCNHGILKGDPYYPVKRVIRCKMLKVSFTMIKSLRYTQWNCKHLIWKPLYPPNFNVFSGDPNEVGGVGVLFTLFLPLPRNNVLISKSPSDATHAVVEGLIRETERNRGNVKSGATAVLGDSSAHSNQNVSVLHYSGEV